MTGNKITHPITTTTSNTDVSSNEVTPGTSNVKTEANDPLDSNSDNDQFDDDWFAEVLGRVRGNPDSDSDSMTEFPEFDGSGPSKNDIDP